MADKLKFQSAMEYLMTYGWAILIIAVALSALIYLGVFNTGSAISSECIAQADFTCLTARMQANGVITVNLQQNTMQTIVATGVTCNTTKTYAGMGILSPQVTIPIGSNYTFANVQCYTKGGAAYSGSVGAVYTGYLVVNYTNSQSGFLHTGYITLIQKVT